MEQPFFSFRVIADVQYTEIPDRYSFHGVPRYYRNNMLVLQRAVQKWNSLGNLKCSINSGDIVDGFCPKDQSLNSVKKVVSEFENFNGPVHHMIGNHCLYNLPRKDLLPLLNITGHAYNDFWPIPSYRFVVLDGYDISALGWPQDHPDHPNTIAAWKFLNEKNPDVNKNSPSGLYGVNIRFLQYNGRIGKEQMEWLDCVLQDATRLEQKVIICCHIALDCFASSNDTILGNYDEVLSIIYRYKCVKSFLAGHEHKGGYRVDSHGIHHKIIDASLECSPGIHTFGYCWIISSFMSQESERCFFEVVAAELDQALIVETSTKLC